MLTKEEFKTLDEKMMRAFDAQTLAIESIGKPQFRAANDVSKLDWCEVFVYLHEITEK